MPGDEVLYNGNPEAPAKCASNALLVTDDGRLYFKDRVNNWQVYCPECSENGKGGNSYVLPVATANRLGGVKVGSGLAIDNLGVLTVTPPLVATDTNFVNTNLISTSDRLHKFGEHTCVIEAGDYSRNLSHILIRDDTIELFGQAWDDILSRAASKVFDVSGVEVVYMYAAHYENNTYEQQDSISSIEIRNKMVSMVSKYIADGYISTFVLDSRDNGYSYGQIESTSNTDKARVFIDSTEAYLRAETITPGGAQGSIRAATNGIFGGWRSPSGSYSGWGTYNVNGGSFYTYGKDGTHHTQGGANSLHPDIVPYVAHQFSSDDHRGFLIDAMSQSQRLALAPLPLSLHGLLVNQQGAALGDENYFFWNGDDRWYRMLAIDEANPVDLTATKMLVINTVTNKIGVQNIVGVGVESLQQTCTVGYTTTTAVIIGSSTTSKAPTAGQLVQGAGSSCTAPATDGVALNASTCSGLRAISLNSSTASGQDSIAAGALSTAGGVRSVAFGGFNQILSTGTDSTIFGGGTTTTEGNIVSGANNLVNGRNNKTIAARLCFVTGRANGLGPTIPAGLTAGYVESNSFMGIQNGCNDWARGCVAMGALHDVGADFSVAMGSGNITRAKGSVAMGLGSKTFTYGEFALSASWPGYAGKASLGNAQGFCQTSIVNMTNHHKTGGNGRIISAKVCTDGAGNAQACAADDANVIGLNYYQLDNDTVHWVQGRLLCIAGPDNTCNTALWTIDTWIKNTNGVITQGTLSFTNVFKEGVFSTMDTASLVIGTVSGSTKSLTATYTNTAGTYPDAEYSCVFTINKLGWKV